MLRHVAVVLLAALCARGKSTGSTANAEPRVAEAPAGAPVNKAPAVPPAKAAPRGPEHPVYSLIDNRLSAHLTRGGGLVVPAGSAGFAKYTRIGNMMKGGKRAW